MKITAKTGAPWRARTGTLAIGVNIDAPDHTLANLDDDVAASARAALASGDVSNKPGEALLVHTPAGSSVRRLLMLATGSSPLSFDAYRRLCDTAASRLVGLGGTDASWHLVDIDVDKLDTYRKTRIGVNALQRERYRFTGTPRRDRPAEPKLARVGMYASERAALRRGVEHGTAIAAGTNLTRDLGNLPGNMCTPTYLARRARSLFKDAPRASVTILSEADMRRLKMGSLLSVSAGSSEPAKLIVMEYKGGPARNAPLVLVGKGITFDTGGISLKPGAAMDEMKFDMCGAGTVFGVMQAALEMQLPVNLVGIVAAAENMPDGSATRPGDVVTSMSGQSIEILNTDAEGRLVLCDAITYARRFKPAAIIDIATLTGAIIVALGKHTTGMFANDDTLADQLLAAGTRTYDRAWRMPLFDEYQSLLKSNFADMANIGGRDAGSITAACFLSRFAGETPWAHLDIAGVAFRSGATKGATGRPVQLLCDWLLERADAL